MCRAAWALLLMVLPLLPVGFCTFSHVACDVKRKFLPMCAPTYTWFTQTQCELCIRCENKMYRYSIIILHRVSSTMLRGGLLPHKKERCLVQAFVCKIVWMEKISFDCVHSLLFSTLSDLTIKGLHPEQTFRRRILSRSNTHLKS